MDPDLKAALRVQALAARAVVPGRAVAEAAMNRHLDALLAAHPGAVVAGYWPMRGEADPRPALTGHTGPLCLPVVAAPASPLLFRRWQPGAVLDRGPLGTRHPGESAPVITPDIVIVPLAAFDAAGGRLGYGGGYYDRTLQALRAAGSVQAAGFAFEAQRLPAIPVEATDQPLDCIITEGGTRRLSTG